MRADEKWGYTSIADGAYALREREAVVTTSLRRVGGALVSTVLLGSGITGCAGGPAVSCSGQANNVIRSSGTSSDMVGKATGSCTAAVALNGFVEIQRQASSGVWYSYKRTPFSLVAKPGVKFTRQAATRCARGKYKTYSYVVGTYKGESETRRSTSGITSTPVGDGFCGSPS